MNVRLHVRVCVQINPTVTFVVAKRSIAFRRSVRRIHHTAKTTVGRLRASYLYCGGRPRLQRPTAMKYPARFHAFEITDGKYRPTNGKIKTESLTSEWRINSYIKVW